VQHAVEPEQSRRLVQLVLDLRSLRNLDHRAEVALDVIAQLDVMPRVHRHHYTEAAMRLSVENARAYRRAAGPPRSREIA